MKGLSRVSQGRINYLGRAFAHHHEKIAVSCLRCHTDPHWPLGHPITTGVRGFASKPSGQPRRSRKRPDHLAAHVSMSGITPPAAGLTTPSPTAVKPLLRQLSTRVRPGPKAHAYLLFGFTLARANARMLINAGSKRSSARNAVRTSRSRSTSQVAVHE